jgi:pimeloyl-ACP methyl ester carboxylesterase
MTGVLAIAALGLAGLLVAGWLWERTCEARQARACPPPGRMIDVGGRRLHLRCLGDGPGPTVVIEQGAGAASFFWWDVQDRIAAFARVCAYDRAGYGWSDAAPGRRSLRERVVELRRLLERAGVPGPYVLVGHSYGGPMISLFARDYPQDVAGLVFADTPDLEEVFGPDYQAVTRRVHQTSVRIMRFATRFGLFRLMGLMGGRSSLTHGLSAQARAAARATRRASAWDAALDDLRSLWTAPAADRQSLAPGSLGALPVAVISHGQAFPGPLALLERGFEAGQARLMALSSNSQRIRLPGAGHLVQIDAPDAVVDAVHRVWAAARSGELLAALAA